MARFDDLTLNLLTGLELCLFNALAPRPNPPEVCQLPGEAFQLFLSAGLNEDRCCSGFAGVRLAALTPRVPPIGEFSPCGVDQWRVDLEMGIARCAPVGDISAGPTCQQWREVVEQVQSDMAAMVEAQCCFAALPEVGGQQNVSFTGWAPFGPDGKCTGGIMGLSVLMGACQCPGTEGVE